MAQLFVPQEVGPAPVARGGLPHFSLVVSPEQSDGWHAAILLREETSPDFFVRSLAVHRPFVIARPIRSARQPDSICSPQELSPAGTSPSRRLIANWGWERRDDATDQLRLYVKCKRPVLLWRKRKLCIRLRLKELSQPHRLIVMEVASETIDWRSQSEDVSMSEHNPSLSKG